MPLTSLFKSKKSEELPYRRDPSLDLAGEYASDQLDPSLHLHWAGNPDNADTTSVARHAIPGAGHAAPLPRQSARSQHRQTTSRALQTIRARQTG